MFRNQHRLQYVIHSVYIYTCTYSHIIGILCTGNIYVHSIHNAQVYTQYNKYILHIPAIFSAVYSVTMRIRSISTTSSNTRLPAPTTTSLHSWFLRIPSSHVPDTPVKKKNIIYLKKKLLDNCARNPFITRRYRGHNNIMNDVIALTLSIHALFYPQYLVNFRQKWKKYIYKKKTRMQPTLCHKCSTNYLL